MRAKVTKPWTNGDELSSVVSRGLAQLTKIHPAVGWVRADQLPADDILAETIRLQKRVGELEKQLREYEEGPPPNTAHLAQGKDFVDLVFKVMWVEENETKSAEATVMTSWDEIFKDIARLLFKSPTESEVTECLAKAYKEEWIFRTSQHTSQKRSAELSHASTEMIRIQFRALGLVTQAHEEHENIKGGRSWGSFSFFRWHLTSYGDQKASQLLALTRS